jgi:hypothetical protein
MVFYVEQSNFRGRRIYPESGSEAEGEAHFEADTINIPLFWEGSRVHPTLTGLPRDLEEDLNEEDKETLIESDAFREGERDEFASVPILQEGWQF